ncbi:hypothetical protein FXE76_04845 [Vibrio cholerae]|nr:hypothetical protein FXE76_04845 [Vibrio cholerae]
MSKSPVITPSSGWHSRPQRTCSNGGSQDYREGRRKNHLFLHEKRKKIHALLGNADQLSKK